MLGRAAGEEGDATREPAGTVVVPPGADGLLVSTGDDTDGVRPPAETEEDSESASVAVTGQTVLEMAMVRVITVAELAGQSVTVGAQLVMVISVVVNTVEVVSTGSEETTGPTDVTAPVPDVASEEDATTTSEAAGDET